MTSPLVAYECFLCTYTQRARAGGYSRRNTDRLVLLLPQLAVCQLCQTIPGSLVVLTERSNSSPGVNKAVHEKSS